MKCSLRNKQEEALRQFVQGYKACAYGPK